DFADDTITLCPSPLPPIETIQVEGYSESKKDAGEPDCNTFHPDAATVRRYFSKARQISRRDWMHKLIMVSCEAYGRMALQDGRKAEWSVSPSRAALIRIDEGGHTRNTSSFARKRIAVSHHSGNKRPFQQSPSCGA
ncbi:hypothetical protein, partial [uncultured Ottowia sp.]|uniref:hypothetical protein n=1 Tax=uncultured Ottowia sp. TaxID=543067 RepID=UPI002599CF2E